MNAIISADEHWQAIREWAIKRRLNLILSNLVEGKVEALTFKDVSAMTKNGCTVDPYRGNED